MTIHYAKPIEFEKQISLFVKCSAVVFSIVGLAAMWGWMSHNSFLVQIRPEYSSMKFNSALSFVLSGLALLLCERGYYRLPALIALLGIVLPVLTLVEYLYGTNLGIDDLFITPFIETKVHYIGRMAPNTATGFVFGHFAILLYALKRPLSRAEEVMLALVGSLIFALGTVPLIGYLGGIETAHTWGDFAGMALPTSICFVLMGCVLIACAWKQSTAMPFWLGIPVATGFLVIALSIWLAVKSYEDIRFEQNLQFEADYVSGRATDKLTAFYLAVDRIANRWMVGGGTPRPVWESDAAGYIKGYPFLKALERIDANGYLQWIVPQEGNEKLFGIKLNTEGTRADAQQRAIDTHASQVTTFVTFLQGDKGFVYLSPLFIQDKFDGFIATAFTMDDFFSKILARDKNGHFYIIVRENDDIIYSNAPADFVVSERWQKSSIVHNKENIWIVSVSPSPDLFATKNSPLQMLVLFTGLLMSCFATASVMQTLKSRRITERVRRSEDRLRQMIDAHSILGFHNFNLQTFMDDIVARVLIITPATGAVVELIENDDMVYKAVSGTVSAYANYRIKREGSLSGLCVKHRQIMISDDTSNDVRVNADACKKVSASSMVIVPLVQRGNVVGVLKALSVQTHAFKDEDLQTLQLIAGLLGGALGQELELTRAQELEEKLRYMAQNDSLTNLPNRILFNDRLTHAIHNNGRNGGFLAIMYMDIDHFKTINDVHGHAHGDALLKAFAVRVTKALRLGDTFARLGGDEFTLIAENLKHDIDAESIAAKIIETTRQPFELPGISLNITISIGVALGLTGDIDAAGLLARADKALYDAKKAGRNCFKIDYPTA